MARGIPKPAPAQKDWRMRVGFLCDSALPVVSWLGIGQMSCSDLDLGSEGRGFRRRNNDLRVRHEQATGSHQCRQASASRTPRTHVSNPEISSLSTRFSARGSVLRLFTLHVVSLSVPRPSSFFLACHVPVEGSTARSVYKKAHAANNLASETEGPDHKANDTGCGDRLGGGPHRWVVRLHNDGHNARDMICNISGNSLSRLEDELERPLMRRKYMRIAG